jgi:hypothetical protein
VAMGVESFDLRTAQAVCYSSSQLASMGRAVGVEPFGAMKRKLRLTILHRADCTQLCSLVHGVVLSTAASFISRHLWTALL